MAISWKRFFNLVAFVALMFVAVALILSYAFKANTFSSAFRTIADVLAFIVVIFYALVYAWKGGTDAKGKIGKRQIIQLALWLIATILVIVFMVL